MSAIAAYHERYPTAVARPTFLEYREWLQHYQAITGLIRLTPAVQDAIQFAESILSRKCIICYIAGALTEASETDKKRYLVASTICEKHGVFGYAPHRYGTDPKKHPRVTPDEVRDIDFLWAVVLADFHINYLWPVAHGNAIEEGWGEYAHIPTIYCLPEEMRASRLTKGMLNIDSVILYPRIASCYRELNRLMGELNAWRRTHPHSVALEFFADRLAKRLPFSRPREDMDRFAAFVADESHPLFGQIGTIIAEDLRTIRVRFPYNRVEEFLNDMGDQICPLVIFDLWGIAYDFKKRPFVMGLRMVI